MSRRRCKRVSHGVDKSTMTCKSEDESGPFSRCHLLTRHSHKVKRSAPPTQEICLIGRMFPCIPCWNRKRPADVTHASSTSNSDNDEVEVKHTLYSEEEEIFPDKTHMQRARKFMRQKLKEEEKTCKRYKIKAKEIEKQFEIFEREIKRKREALRKKTEPSKSEEEISRVLNTLLCTNIHYDPDIITKIKILLKEKPKLQCYFNECSHKNSLTNPLRYKLFSRVGIDSKLKIFFNSKKRMNAEHRELLRAIVDQVNKEYGEDEKKSNGGDTMIDKIYRILWRPEGLSTEQQSKSMPQGLEQTYSGTSSQHGRRRTFCRDDYEHKKTTEINNKVHPEISGLEKNIAKNEKKNRRTHITTSDNHHCRRSRSHGRNIMKFEGCDAKGYVSRSHESQPFRLEQLRFEALKEIRKFTNESDIEEEIRETKLGETRQLSVMAAKVARPRFNLLGFLKSTPKKNKNNNKKDKRKDNDIEYDDMILNGRRKRHKKCFRCDKATETDLDTQYLTDFNKKSDGSEDSSEDLEESEEKKAGGSYRFWNPFSRDHNGKQCRKQKTIWTNK